MPQQQPGEQASGQPAPGGWGGVKAAVGRSFAQLGLEPADLPPAFLLHELLGLTIAAGLWTACYSFAPVRRLAASVAGGKSPALRGAAAARLQRAQDAAMAKAAQAVRRMSWLRKGADPARLTASLAESLVIGWAIKPVTCCAAPSASAAMTSFLSRYLGGLTWSAKDIPSLAGCNYIVTGGSSGIGFVACKRLAEHGGRVILAARDAARSRDAINNIRAEVPDANVDFMEVDLSSFKSIRKFADDFRATGQPLHCLVNNAGVQIPEGVEKTEDGFEVHVGTVVFMSSPQEARSPGIPWDDLMGEHIKPGESSMDWYGTANLCKIMVAKELATRLEGTGDFSKKESSMLDWTQKLMGQSEESGALSTLYCATEPSLEGKSGSYFGPWYGSSGMAVNVGNTMELEPSSDEAKNPKARSKLYELAAKIATEKLGSQLSNLPPQRAPPT
eukprot:scaffold12.g8265.t1